MSTSEQKSTYWCLPAIPTTTRMSTYQHKLYSFVLALVLISISVSSINCEPDDSFEDLVYEYYTFPNEDDLNAQRGRNQEGLVSVGELEESLEKPGEITEPEGEYTDLPQPSNEFEFTLGGMMSALSEIQRRGDTVMEGVRIQQRRLEELNGQLVVMRNEQKTLDATIQELEQEKSALSLELGRMREEKDAVVLQVEESHNEINRMMSDMGPLSQELEQRRIEIRTVDTQINEKRQELARYQTEVEQAATALSEKLGSVDVSLPAQSTLSPLSLGLLISLLANLLLAAPYIRQFVAEAKTRSDIELTQFTPVIRDSLAKFAPIINERLAQFAPPSRRKPAKSKLPVQRLEAKQLYVTDRMEKLEKRFKDKSIPDMYYDLPRTL